MVDFKKLSANADKRTPKNILETFENLDRQVSHVELRPTQIRIIDALTSRIDERDVVLKLNTGGGKTTIGLLYLKHQLNRHSEPVVYLVPTVQLAEQVAQEGVNIGFPVYHWKAGEKHPPEEALRHDGAIVCTYEKFFNAKSTFARQQVTPSAIVLDDVHAGIESIRDCFGCDLPLEARSNLIALMGASLATHDPIAWSGIERSAPDAVLEIPFWILNDNYENVVAILSKYSESKEMRFVWANIAPILDLARIFISGGGSYLLVDPPAVDRVNHFSSARHRLFMSASVHDGAVLVRELGCDPKSASNPVEVSAESSVGERMVIVPSLIDPEFTDQEIFQIVGAITTVANVVVLVPSFSQAHKWEAIGATVALNENIKQTIATLKSSPKGNLVVFSQRYDGIDLPDSACRLLVIDGLPQGESLADAVESTVTGGIAGMRGKTANKIEQGLGRAVRSSSDYCAVLLVGRDLAGFVSRKNVEKSFSPHTVKQMHLGKKVSEAIGNSSNRASAVYETLNQSLRRDPDWKAYYAAEMARTELAPELREIVESKLETANLERQAIRLASARDYGSAHALLQRASDICKEPEARAVLKQAAAKFQYFYDKLGAMKMQASAYSDNANISRPPMLLPSHLRRVTQQAEEIAVWLKDFNDPNGALIELDSLRSKLSFAAGFKVVEAGLMELGAILGADSSRPEKQFGRGPDNLWIFGREAFVIEAKSSKSAKLSKGDAEQLNMSVLWTTQNYKDIEKINAVLVSHVCAADVVGDFGFGAVVWMQSDIEELLVAMRRMSSAAVAQGSLFYSSSPNIQGMLSGHQLLPGQIRSLGHKIV